MGNTMKSCTESDFRTTHPTPWALCRCRADSRAQPEHPGGPREDCELGTASEHLGFPPEDCEPSTASEHPGVPPEDCEPGTASEHLGSPQECGRLLSCIACPTGHISAARSMPSGGFPTCRRRKWKQGSQWCLRETLPGFPLPVSVGGHTAADTRPGRPRAA